MSERLKYERFLWFHGQVKVGKHPNTTHLVETFEISGRTAQRDIEFIRDRLRAPLVFDHSKNGYHYSETTYELPALWIDETSILTLSLAVRLASTIPDRELKDNLCQFVNRLTAKSDTACSSNLKNIGEKISVKNIEYAMVDMEVFRKTVEALFADHSLQITYHSPHTSITTDRTIQPLHLMQYMGNWHILAWCALRNNLRNFALARIEKITHSNIILSIPDNLPKIKDYSRRHFGILQGNTTKKVILRFTPQLSLLIKEQIWHPEQQTTTEPNGSLTLTFPVADFRELVKIILSHGANVEVLEPPDLRVMVNREIELMAKIYPSHDIT
ncbi:MAG: WYL domain-containing protein [Desulfobulbaceae bacterium]|nr:WYL domain-containing protein [Desulfobulbaceae bacterium]